MKTLRRILFFSNNPDGSVWAKRGIVLLFLILLIKFGMSVNNERNQENSHLGALVVQSAGGR